MKKNGMRLVPPEDGLHIPADIKIWTAQLVEGASDEVYADVGPVVEWFKRHETRRAKFVRLLPLIFSALAVLIELFRALNGK